MIDGGGLEEITSSIAGAVGGSALVFDAALRQVARHPSKGSPRAEDVVKITEEISGRLGSSGAGATSFEPEALPDRGLVVPVPGRRGAPPAGWLVVRARSAASWASSSASSPARLRSSSALSSCASAS